MYIYIYIYIHMYMRLRRWGRAAVLRGEEWSAELPPGCSESREDSALFFFLSEASGIQGPARPSQSFVSCFTCCDSVECTRKGTCNTQHVP